MTSQVASAKMTGTGELQRLRFALMASEYSARFGARVQKRRKELGWSRAELARRLPGKTNENQVYRWEKGKHLPEAETQELIAKELGVSLAALLTPDDAEVAESGDAPRSDETPELVGLIADLRLQQSETNRLLRELLGRKKPLRFPPVKDTDEDNAAGSADTG